jgi:hypothetical protein
MTIAKALVFGTLLTLGCSGEPSGGAIDEGSLTDASTGSTEPVMALSSGGNAHDPDAQPTPTAQPNPTTPSISEQPPTPQLQQPSPAGKPDPEQPSGAEVASTSPGIVDPQIPAVSVECPEFRTGTISFMGLGGIQLVAGAKAAAATAPMVFYWHGTGSTSSEFGIMAGAVRDGVQAEGGVLVSFQGTTGGDALSGTSVFGKGDMDLVDQLVACAVRDHNVDPRRIFTTGCSAGGLLSGALAALRSSYIAAAAPNSGGFTFQQQFQNNFTPALMTVHGAPGRDVVVVDFSKTSATADKAFKGHGGFVIDCNHGGGHCGGGGLAPDVWEFFEAHPYGVEPAPSPWASGLPSELSDQCAIF